MSFKRQSRDYTCGVASIYNALVALRIAKYTQGSIRKFCHADPVHGTPEEEIVRGVLATGMQADIASFNKRTEAIGWLTLHLQMRGPAIISVDLEDHWVTVVGLTHNGFVVFDPALGEGGKTYTARGLASRWRARTQPHYYAIGVAK